MSFRCEFEVRDTEIDIEGIVSNPNYFIYLMHARHKYVESIGYHYNEQIKNKQLLVLLATQTDFVQSLRPNDTFYVTCTVLSANSRVKFNCYQEIHRCYDDALILKSTNTITCINDDETNPRKRFYIPEKIAALLTTHQ